MPPPTRILRGLSDIRTRAGTSDQGLVPYRAYMVITVLEIEKHRRRTERQNLITRLKNVSVRLRAIDTEKAALLERLGQLPRPCSMGGAAASRHVHLDSARCRPAGAFKHQY